MGIENSLVERIIGCKNDVTLTGNYLIIKHGNTTQKPIVDMGPGDVQEAIELLQA
jgi:hypothetical protein